MQPSTCVAVFKNMLRAYITKNRPELLAMIKHVDKAGWARISALPAHEQIDLISIHPEVRAGVAHHLLSQAGFDSGSIIQHRITRGLFHLNYPIISLDSDGVPVHAVLYGRPVSNNTASPGYLGRLEEFVSTSSGVHLVPAQIFHLIPKI